ncbi:hypothetical protein SOASR032_13700 [Pragia fontium]|uniref:Uncharacterized protein n=1 Tax=Pragia fontium TaxID=82985 RepID=A0ABQ5LIM1_9GAMM|nr:hypothetical protein [Pragia fontium]GKX62801.1 hypothetical protein SOASR032_13700 [Pragia fontium]
MKIVKVAPFDRYHFDDIHLSSIDKLFIKPKHERPTFNRSMFDEDFARIFRSTSQRSCNLFCIESNDDELTQRLLGNIKTSNEFHDINETIRELIEEIARSVIWFGKVYYSLNELPEEEKIYIAPFSAIGVFSFFKAYLQLVPRRREKYRDDEERPRELRILDKAKLMRFTIPKSIRRKLSEQNRTLAVLDKHQYDGTGLSPQATHENPNPRNDFDFLIWRDTQERALYRATRETGWNGRKSDSSKCSDFFVCHRLIRFRRNQLILRDHILEQLGNEFTRVGRQYNTEFHVVISPTNELTKIAELDDLEARLSREEVSFSKVLDFCYER